MDLSNSVVSDNYIRGVTVSSCAAGKVCIDGVDSYDNGIGGSDLLYSGIYISSSEPEVINCQVYDNGCNGVACVTSSPDMNTYYYSMAHPNSIYSNGSGTQTGSNGAEIYICALSAPVIEYNNIYDVETGFNVGAMLWRIIESLSSGVIDAKNNYWGSVGRTAQCHLASVRYCQWAVCIDAENEWREYPENGDVFEIAINVVIAKFPSVSEL